MAIAISAFIVWLLPFHSVTAEILAKTNPTLLDLAVALFSGLAGSVAVCRVGGSDGVTTLPGVAVAVALMPPLCTVGFGLGSGVNTRIMGGAGLLFLTNMVAIVASAFLVFLLTGMNARELRAETEHSRKGELLSQKMSQWSFSRALIGGGQLRWRVLLLVILLGAIALPLRTAFRQVASETIVRGAIQDVVKRLLPPGALLSQQVEVGRDSVAVRLIATAVIPDDKIQEAERAIEKRSGRKVFLSVASIASQSELAELMQRLSTTMQPTAPPPVESLEKIHSALIARIEPVLKDVWPAAAPLGDFDIDFSSAGIVINVQYQSTRSLDKIAQDIILRDLQEKLGTPAVLLATKRIPPPRKAAATAHRSLH